jgi:hypothetical protein
MSRARLLDAVRDAAVGEHREPLEREGRARAVAHEPFARAVVVGADGDGDGGVQVEPVELDGVASESGRLVMIAVGAAGDFSTSVLQSGGFPDSS